MKCSKTGRPRLHAIIGTKAQLIKMGPILQMLQVSGVAYNFVLTGQHSETFDALRENFELKDPDASLVDPSDVVGLGQMFFWLCRALCNGIWRRRELFGDVGKDDIFLVHGDTLSTLLGAILGRVLGATVCHVESGLRSFSLLHPFPEELTRLMVFRLSHVYFCPGQWAVANLKGYPGVKCDTKANSLYDALRGSRVGAKKDGHVPETRFALCTIHRFENIFQRERLEWILGQVEKIAEAVPVVFILHAPTRKQLERYQLLQRLEQNCRITLRPRYDYFQFMELVRAAEFVVSDGGSNQEECYYLGVPCLLMRNKTERQEGIGQNIVLSRYDESLVADFLKRYSDFRSDPLDLQESPSSIIVNWLRMRFEVRNAPDVSDQ